MAPKLPVHDELTDVRPATILLLMADLAEAALSANIDLIDPLDVRMVGPSRVGLVRSAANATVALDDATAPAIAPEATRSGPTPATLSYAVGAIGAWAALGTLDPPPGDPAAHAEWLLAVTKQLAERFAGHPDAEATIGWIARCLQFDPFQRPQPRRIVAAPANRVPTPIVVPPTGDPAVLQTLATPHAERRADGSLFLVVGAALALGIASCTLGAVASHWWDEPPPATQVVVSPLAPRAAAAPAPAPAPEPPRPAPAPRASPRRPAPEPPPLLLPAEEPPPPPPEPVRTGPGSDLRNPWDDHKTAPRRP